MIIVITLAPAKQKGSFRGNGLTSDNCLLYEKSLIVNEVLNYQLLFIFDANFLRPLTINRFLTIACLCSKYPDKAKVVPVAIVFYKLLVASMMAKQL